MIKQVCRAYLLKGPCQPRNHDFPQKIEANRKRKFVSAWFDEFKMWLEYSIAKDDAFCLYCYLFSSGSSEKGHDAFISGGFNTWRKKDRLRDHVGEVNSDHNKCRLACQDLMNQAQHIEGYDGASNMRGEFSGLKTLILKRNPNAYYVNCFAHQLQLTIVVVSKKHIIVGSFFNTISRLCNVVGGSCKRRDMLRENLKSEDYGRHCK
ncbi:uncharacterized protein LOC130998185 [Salvia miltiorrhiza]|uniref:uncharacterized protein LOC130998185 n=1 Tax=Salvia miltiorrhiza TaxID=226208 RepID=UPI0025ABBF3B|nr:uncharacterized protein LOC130998185 [Salvia miltiorrhiza]